MGKFLGLFGDDSDKVQEQAQPFQSANAGYDPNAQFYNGDPNGLANYNKGVYGDMTLTEGRAAPTANYAGADQAQGSVGAWDNASQQSREQQQQVANLQWQRATGQVPSIAGQQSAADISALQRGAQAQGQQALQQNAAQAASARGAAGLALAQQTAGNNTANAMGNIGQATAQATQNISNQAQVNAANERLQAENAAQGAYSGIRSGDQSNQGLATQEQAQQAQQAQFQATQQLASRNANDQRYMGDQGLIANANQAQLGARMQNQGNLAGSQSNASSLNMGAAGQNAQRSGQSADTLVNLGLKGAQGGAGAAAAMAKGGPAARGKVYLMGEEGPELVVPRCNGGMILAEGGRRAEGGAVEGVEVTPGPFRERFDQEQDYAAKKDFDDWAKSYTDRGSPDLTPQRAGGGEASPKEQADFEAQLIDGGKDSNQAEAAKIRKGFANDERDRQATAQWERVNGPAPKAGQIEGQAPKAGWQRALGALAGQPAAPAASPPGPGKSPLNSYILAMLAQRNPYIGPQAQPVALEPGGARAEGGSVEGVQHLYETPETGPLDTAGYSVREQEDSSHPSLSGSYNGPGASSGAPKAKAAPKAAPRRMTPDELMAAANAMGSQMQTEHAARMAAGPAVGYGGARALGGPVMGMYAGSGPGNPWAYKDPVQAASDMAFSSVHQSGGMGGGYGGAREDGGPVQGASAGAEKPYVVGKNGPELVVPKKDAEVIPAPETAVILAEGGAGQKLPENPHPLPPPPADRRPKAQDYRTLYDAVAAENPLSEYRTAGRDVTRNGRQRQGNVQIAPPVEMIVQPPTTYDEAAPSPHPLPSPPAPPIQATAPAVRQPVTFERDRDPHEEIMLAEGGRPNRGKTGGGPLVLAVGGRRR